MDRFLVALVNPTRLAPALMFLATGCVTVYQPLSGLHAPAAIDTQYANLEGVGVSVTCVPGDALDRAESQDLCRKVSRALENQGAAVRSHTEDGEADPGTRSAWYGALEAAGIRKPKEAPSSKADENKPAEPEPPVQLAIRLSSRIVHEETSSFLAWSWVDDYTFAQDVEIRDEAGFLLIRDALVGRFERTVGWTNWTSNATPDFTADFYRQLKQRTLNARMRRQLLREGGP